MALVNALTATVAVMEPVIIAMLPGIVCRGNGQRQLSTQSGHWRRSKLQRRCSILHKRWAVAGISALRDPCRSVAEELGNLLQGNIGLGHPDASSVTKDVWRAILFFKQATVEQDRDCRIAIAFAGCLLPLARPLVNSTPAGGARRIEPSPDSAPRAANRSIAWASYSSHGRSAWFRCNGLSNSQPSDQLSSFRKGQCEQPRLSRDQISRRAEEIFVHDIHGTGRDLDKPPPCIKGVVANGDEFRGFEPLQPAKGRGRGNFGPVADVPRRNHEAGAGGSRIDTGGSPKADP